MIIRDAGNGVGAGVTEDGYIKTIADSHPIQHHASLVHQDAYQILGDFASINNSTENILHIKNSSSTMKFVITYVRVQMLDFAGGTAVPNVATYFVMGKGLTYTSGGTGVTPVNMNFASGKTADLVCYDNDPVLGGSLTEIDRWYVESEGKMMTYNKEGSVILGQNDTFAIQVVSDHTSGVAHARVSGFFTKEQ
jgi:hypothetical protein